MGLRVVADYVLSHLLRDTRQDGLPTSAGTDRRDLGGVRIYGWIDRPGSHARLPRVGAHECTGSDPVACIAQPGRAQPQQVDAIFQIHLPGDIALSALS